MIFLFISYQNICSGCSEIKNILLIFILSFFEWLLKTCFTVLTTYMYFLFCGVSRLAERWLFSLQWDFFTTKKDGSTGPTALESDEAYFEIVGQWPGPTIKLKTWGPALCLASSLLGRYDLNKIVWLYLYFLFYVTLVTDVNHGVSHAYGDHIYYCGVLYLDYRGVVWLFYHLCGDHPFCHLSWQHFSCRLYHLQQYHTNMGESSKFT